MQGMAEVDIAQLLELARESRSGDRERLLESLGQLFVSEAGRLSDRERALVGDILCKLIADVEVAVRRRLAERLAAVEALPREVVDRLLDDSIEVARPILLRSRVLQDPDLIEIVRWRSQEHRLAVAMREGLSEAVGDALIERGEEDVIAALVENPDSSLSRAAVEHLVEESRRIDRFQEPLLRRAELPPELAHRMFWWVSAALRQHILERWSGSAHLLDRHLEAATQGLLADAGPPAASTAERLAEALSQQGRLDARFLLQSLRQGRVAAFIAGLAQLAEVDQRTARSIVFSADGDALAVACRAIDVDRNTFATIYMLTRSARDGAAAGALKPDALARRLSFYDSISRESARVALRYWRRDSAYLSAIREIEEGNHRVG